MFKAFDILTCFVGEHDPRIVLLAIAICILSSLTALDLFRRARSAERPARWVLMGGAAGGCGIWATHFVGMLAYTPNIPVAYDILLTFLSLGVAVVMTTLALGIAVEDVQSWRSPAGGVILGIGVGAMHYIGTASLEIPGRIEWDWALVSLSILAGVALSTAAILVARRGESGLILLESTALLVLAIVVMHFVGMAGIRIVLDPTQVGTSYIFSPEILAIAIAGVSVALLGTGLATALADRQLSGQARAFGAEIHLLKQSAVWLSRHDVLTDLPNRTAFNEILAAVSVRVDSFALLSIGLDRFKDVNDVFGHSAGDQLLQCVAKKLLKASESAFLARIGGDEFAVIVTEGKLPKAAEDLARQLTASLANPFEIDGHQISIGMSVGMAVFPEDGDAETIRASADFALASAKATGKGEMRRFDHEMGARLHERIVLKQDLGRARDANEFSLHYQPQAARDGEFVGFEALLRWRHPKFGPVSPNVFIPLAEESGLIVQIGAWVLREACREAVTWRRPLRIAVNLSPVQFRQNDLPETIHAVLLETGLPPERLELEITEGVLVDDLCRASSILHRLKLLGVAIAIDDFGTGYSSLSYLHAFPFDRIKVDQSFISRLHSDAQSNAIVRAIINLGHGLGLSVIAEGVEHKEQLDFLIAEGCDEVQGFSIGLPSPISSYVGTVAKWNEDQADGLPFERSDIVDILRQTRPVVG